MVAGARDEKNHVHVLVMMTKMGFTLQVGNPLMCPQASKTNNMPQSKQAKYTCLQNIKKINAKKAQDMEWPSTGVEI